MSGRLHAPAALPLGKQSPIGGWVGPRDGLDALTRKFRPLPVIEPRSSSQELVIPDQVFQLQHTVAVAELTTLANWTGSSTRQEAVS